MSLSVENLSFAYGAVPVLRDVSFTAEGGELVSVLGPNGVGKTTLFRCILGTLTPQMGHIKMDGQDLATLPPRERARRIAYIPQIHPPTFGYTALDTVLMGAARQLNAFQQPGAAQIRQADEALEQVGAAHLRERNFAHLSGGEQQLVLIARALAQKAEVLMMDEPTSALDYGNQLRILQMVRRLAAQGYTVILSTHNPQHALTFATTLLALHGGTAAAWGRPAQVLTPELFQYKLTQYPEGVGQYADFIRNNWLGKHTADCVGLIKGYGWLIAETMEIEYGTNGMPDIGANQMYYNATRKGTIDTIPEVPGLAVWKSGHIGVYIGDGQVIEAMGTKYGVVKTQLQGRGWTHWLEIPYINYD